MNILILIKLLVAHIIGDFFLQPDWMCNGKKSNGFKKHACLAIHSIINAASAYIFVGIWECWLIPVVVFITHYLIDLGKSWFNSTSIVAFVTDQLLHIAVNTLLWVWITDFQSCLSFYWLSDYRIWVVVGCYLLVLKPSSILLGVFIAKWTPKGNEQKSLENGGEWIGYFERVLILTFMLLNCMEGIGFLLAAKSVFRFGELTKANEVKTTEYVMIGTLASFTIAILSGIIAQKVLGC